MTGFEFMASATFGSIVNELSKMFTKWLAHKRESKKEDQSHERATKEQTQKADAQDHVQDEERDSHWRDAYVNERAKNDELVKTLQVMARRDGARASAVREMKDRIETLTQHGRECDHDRRELRLQANKHEVRIAQLSAKLGLDQEEA